MAGPSQELEQQQQGTTDNLPRWCAEEPCRRRPFFGPVGGKPIFCQQHSRKTEGMVDVSSRRCEAVGCAKWPLYGHEGQKAKFCSLHKGPSMIDVRSRRCAAPDCKRQPSYGFEGKRACFCAAHKAEGMVDVVSRRCERPNCRRRPLYGFEGKKSQFCSAHKQEGQVDVCNRRCQFPGCSKRPCFGLPGKRPCFCGSHRSVEMVDVISHKCNYPGCSHPTGYETNRVRSKFCDQHKSVGLAGASLLQLAVPVAFDDAAHQLPTSRKALRPGGSANLSKDPWKSGAEPGVSVEEPRRNGRPQVAVGASESGSGASPPRTRFPEPVSGEVPSRDVKSEATAERRIVGTGASSLPSLGALLDEIPRTHLKRPREARDGEHGTGSVTLTLSSAAETTSSAVAVSSSAVTSSKSSLSSSSSPSLPTYPSQPILSPPPLEVPGIAFSKFGDGVDNCTSKGKGMAKMNGVNHDTDGSKKCGGAMDEGGRCASASLVVSSQHRSAAGVKRLFSRPERGSRRWQTAGTEWNSQLPVETGFLTRSPTPDWRQAGLSSLGRTASLQEAQTAALRQGLEVDDGKPRRASAFFTHGSSLPPVVTEMGRRCSALESRRAPIRAPHYSELLSAKAPLRSVTAYAGGVERHRLFPGFERQHGAGAENEPEARLGISLLAPEALPSIQSLTAPSPNRQPSSDDAAGYNRSLDEDATGVRFTRYVSPAKRVFHVIPAAAAYMAGSALPSRGAGFPANASLPSRLEWQRERLPPPKRFSLSSVTALEVSEPEISRDYRKALRTTPQKEQGHFPAMDDRCVAADQDNQAFVPAWGAVVEGEADYIEKRGDTARYNTGVACISSGATLSGQRAVVCGGYSSGEGNAPSPGCLPRSGSMLSDRERGILSGGSNLSHPRRPSTLEQSLSVAGIHELSRPKSPAAGLPPQPTNSATSSPGAEGQAGSSLHAWRSSTAERPSTSPSKQGNTFREAADEAHTIVKGSAGVGGPARHNFDVGFNSGPGSVRRGSVAPALETMEPSMRPSMSRLPFISPSVLAARESKDTLTAQPGRLQRESFVGEK